MKNEDRNLFKTSDISFSAYLLTLEIPFIGVQEDIPHHFVFVFSDPIKCNELKRQYLNNGVASARQLFSQREMLILEMKTMQRNGESHYEKLR